MARPYKLTPEQRSAIASALKAKTRTVWQLAEDYGVCESTIRTLLPAQRKRRMTRQSHDLTGLKFGNWLVLHMDPDAPSGIDGARWICQCSCGNAESVGASNLTSSRSTKCTACRDIASRQAQQEVSDQTTRIPLKSQRHRITLACDCVILTPDAPHFYHTRYACPSGKGHGYRVAWKSYTTPNGLTKPNTGFPSDTEE